MARPPLQFPLPLVSPLKSTPKPHPLPSAAAIINQQTHFPEHKALLLVDQPFDAYQKIVSHFRPFQPLSQNISESAVIGEGSVVMPGAVIGNGVTIGRNTVVYPNVVIMDHCTIGDEVIIPSFTFISTASAEVHSVTDCFRTHMASVALGKP